jgi:osmotically inducible protein OsmC
MSTPQSGLFAEQRYSFNTRFGEEKGTNPEELLAASHAGCFSMALGFMLEKAGFKADRIDTRAEVQMETGEAGPSATGVNLVVSAKVPGIDAAQFAAVADNAKKNCVISRALGIPVTMQATLAG